MHNERQTWTHAHNGVHNPSRVPKPMRALLHADFVGVLDVWMAEHHAHHAHTNSAEADPDVRWWYPAFSYADVARGATCPLRTCAFAVLAYPFLVPVMLLKSPDSLATKEQQVTRAYKMQRNWAWR